MKVLKRVLSFATALTMGMCMFTGCASKEENKLPSSEPADPYASMSVEEAMVARSYISSGNTYRLKKAVDKAQSGQDVTIAYIGGSITEGIGANADTCYAALSAKQFEKDYCKNSSVNFVNAGMSGTPSIIGCARVQRDVTPYNPDIVFVEFAVNDGTETEMKKAYESLVRTLLNLESAPAVILIFNVIESGHTCKEHMGQIGAHYDLGMISPADSLTAEFEAKRMTWSDYSDDQSHPNAYGHQLLADFIKNYYEKALSQEADSEYTMPQDVLFGNEFENCVYIDAQEIAASDFGSFVPAFTMQQFPNGVANAKDGTNNALKLSLEAKSVIFIYKQTAIDPWGNAQLIVNGITETVLMGKMTGGWGGPAYHAISSNETQSYDIEIKMVDTSVDKTFELVAIGVVY